MHKTVVEEKALLKQVQEKMTGFCMAKEEAVMIPKTWSSVIEKLEEVSLGFHLLFQRRINQFEKPSLDCVCERKGDTESVSLVSQYGNVCFCFKHTEKEIIFQSVKATPYEDVDSFNLFAF